MLRRKNSHQPALLLAFMLHLIILPACNREQKPKEFVIGFSQCVESDIWRKTMLQEMKRALSFHPNVKFIYRDADGNSERQIAQVKELLSKGIDLLIISPNEAAPLTPIVEATYMKGLPVIVVDRKISTPSYAAYVGGDNYNIGKMAGEYAVHILKGKGNIIEITGLPKSTPAIERDKGFEDALRDYPGIHVKKVNGEWYKQIAKKKMNELAETEPADLVFAQNDMMALATYEVYKNKDLSIPRIIGVDGLPCKGCGMEFVSHKLITATMLYPTGGLDAIQIAMQILNKEKYKKENVIQTTVIDSTNVHFMQLQADKMNSQQVSIEQQQTLLDQLKSITSNQRTFLYVLISSLALALVSGGVLFYLFRQNRTINRKLQAQNKEILSKKEELEIMSARAQVANEAKVSFFTKISHEFRTPLTLILAPLEELQKDVKGNQRWIRNLNLIYKNVIRLLRLVNQLMDFRKIEVEKMHLQDTENDIIAFANEIIQSYQSIALKRNIDLRLLTAEPYLNVWFDVNMLDKVFFNLLSNAFKFTRDGGYIHLGISRSSDGKEAVIKVEDNGVGMEEDAVKNAFSVFYQGEFENQKGSGLGLSLSKEIINMHQGTIEVNSRKGTGTTFIIHLPLSRTHQNGDDHKAPAHIPFVFYNNEKIYTADLLSDLPLQEPDLIKADKEHTLLIIEDNEDLRIFLKNRLKSGYEILEADNGQSAVQQAFDAVPDLIISDVMIPGKDGMALVNIFKSDIRTSHIPVIMLTGKADIEHQIEGMKNRADAYIIKPFDVALLEQTIQSLLINRAILKEHFTADLSSKLKSPHAISKIDRKFVNDFTVIVEHNLSNEDFSIEDICKEMGISRIQLYRKVKALLNMNVNDFILNTRLQKAKYLLQHEDMSISEISYKSGFSSPAYFSTVFKSKFGMTPKAYKEK